MVDSIHSARWIEQFRDQDIDFLLFPSTPNRQVHPRIATMLRDDSTRMSLSIAPFRGRLSIPLWGADLIFSNRVRGVLLRQIMSRFKPDYVHALELQHGGYIASRAYGDSTDLPPLIATNWGSDIYWFRRFPGHERRLRRLMGQASFYSAECERDVELAKELGFGGRSFKVFPNAGGFPAAELAGGYTPPSSRRTIVIKGYESFVGRASTALKAVERVASELAGYRILVYSANPKTQRLAAALVARTGLDITTFPKKSLSHEQMFDMFRESRVYLGVSLSDGISTSLLEAMAGGAFPIQTNTSCASEWIRGGVDGFTVDAVNLDEITEALRVGLTDDAVVESAAVSNLATAQTRLDEKPIRENSFQFYGLSPIDINSA
jgi:glycosyltransferase involved in cell wall biosynthesis